MVSLDLCVSSYEREILKVFGSYIILFYFQEDADVDRGEAEELDQHDGATAGVAGIGRFPIILISDDSDF